MTTMMRRNLDGGWLVARSATLTAGALALAIVGSTAVRAQDAAAAAGGPPTPAQCGIPGHHALLERMTIAFVLSCEQELKLEPLLHDEESVSKPLINFPAFSAEEKKDVMQEVKVAARKQIRPLLTPVQQAKMDEEIDTVSKGGEGLQKKGGGGGKGGGKKAKAEETASAAPAAAEAPAAEAGGKKGAKKADAGPVDPYMAEESLTKAITKYAALSEAQKKELILKVKKASRRPDAPAMTAEQAKEIDAQIAAMSS